MRSTIRWVRDPASVMQEGFDRYGDIWRYSMQGNTSFVLVCSPETVKQVFTAPADVLLGGEANSRIGTALMGQHSVILMDGDEHRAARRLLLPPFHGDTINRFKERVQRACEESLAEWPLQTPIEMLGRMQEITLHTIMSAVFGVDDSMRERVRERVTNLVTFASSEKRMAMMHVANRIGRLPPSFLRVRSGLDEVLLELVKAGRVDPRLDQREDVLGMLLRTVHEDGSPLSDTELRDVLVTLLMQGHMSTGTALAWTIERLIRHPEAYARLQAEVENGHEEYLDAVIKEAMRVRPPVPIAMRTAAVPYEIGGYQVDAGSLLAPCVFLLHRNPAVYPDPASFRPERFLDAQPGPYTWIPFGGGERHCIGRSFALMEIREVLRTLVLRARLATTDAPGEPITRRGVMFSPKLGARAVLRERVAAATYAAA